MNNYFLPETNEIKSKINLVLYFTILAYTVSLFLNDAPVVTNILMGLMFILSFFSPSSDGYWKRIVKNRVNAGILVFYLWQVLSVLVSENVQSGLHILILRLPLLILPLAFCFIDFEKKTWDKILLFYAVATTIASLFGFLYGVYRAAAEQDTGFLYSDNISDFLGRQSVYFALYVGVAILVFVIQLKEYPPKVLQYRYLIYFSIAWLLFIMFMLASRTAMFGILLVMVIYVFKKGIQNRKFFGIILILFSLIIGSIVVSRIFPKTLNRFNGTTELNFQYDNRNVENHFNAVYDTLKWNGTNTRAAIWTCAFEIWRTQPIMGTGLGDRNDALMNKYKENQFWYGLGSQKNTHNQYLDVLLSMGIVGLLVFVGTLFFYPIRLAFKQKHFFSILFYVLLGLCFVTENMLDRYQGLIFIAFILPVISKVTKSQEDH